MAPEKDYERFKVINAPRPQFKVANSTREHFATKLASLDEDECIECENVGTGHLYTLAKYSGFKIQTQRQKDGKIRIWRVK